MAFQFVRVYIMLIGKEDKHPYIKFQRVFTSWDKIRGFGPKFAQIALKVHFFFLGHYIL